MNSSILNFKKPIWRQILIAAAVLTLLFLCDRLFYLGLSGLADGFYARSGVGTDYYGKTEFIRPGAYNCLIAGTSKAKEAVMPLYLYEKLGIRAHNAASPGRYPRYHYHYYQTFREQNGPPALCLYGMDYFTFGKASNEQQLQSLLGGGKERKTWKMGDMKNPSSAFWSRISHLYRAKPQIDAFWVDLLDYLAFRHPLVEKPDITPGGISRYKGLFGTVPRENLVEPAQWSRSAYEASPGAEGDYFVKLLEALRRDRVLVVLLILPEFRPVWDTNHEHDRQLADLTALSSRFTNIFILDYNRPDRFDLDSPALFADGRYGERISHLSVFGAERLAGMLASDIRRLQKEWLGRRGS
jgi:hypothetical protein